MGLGDLLRKCVECRQPIDDCICPSWLDEDRHAGMPEDDDDE